MVVRNFGMMVFETLYGRDETMTPQPLMLAGEVIDDDGHRRTMTLRDGLRFHDGEPVLARDCVTSLRRWMKRDPVGATIEARRRRAGSARRPDHPVAAAQAVPASAQGAVEIPDRRGDHAGAHRRHRSVQADSRSDRLRPVPLPGEGASARQFCVVRAQRRYVPRSEQPSFTAGGHRALVDRVEWHMIPDPGTAANALMAGEMDWIEMPIPDLLPLLERAPGVVTGRLDHLGLHQSVASEPFESPHQQRVVPPRHDGGDRPARGDAGRDGRDPSGFVTPVGFLVTGESAGGRSGSGFCPHAA